MYTETSGRQPSRTVGASLPANFAQSMSKESTMSPALAAVLAPVPVSADLPCRAGDADLWFAELPAEVEMAKAACGPCPMREACLAGALARSEPWGVWGGELFIAGAIVARKRPRGRPRKEWVAA